MKKTIILAAVFMIALAFCSAAWTQPVEYKNNFAKVMFVVETRILDREQAKNQGWYLLDSTCKESEDVRISFHPDLYKVAVLTEGSYPGRTFVIPAKNLKITSISENCKILSGTYTEKRKELDYCDMLKKEFTYTMKFENVRLCR